MWVIVAALSMLGGSGGVRGGFWGKSVWRCLCRLGLHITFGRTCGVCRRPSSDAVLSQS
jgi:hypothetical protein